MDTTKICQLKLTKDNLVDFNFSEDYKVVFVNKKNYPQYLEQLLHLSNLMKDDFTWVGIPDKQMLKRRFESFNSSVQLFYYNDLPIGWTWGNPNFTPLWEITNQPLQENEIYTGGSFLSQKVKKPKGSGTAMYYLTYKKFLYMDGIDCLYAYVDNWNHKSIHLLKKIGFTNFNFIKE